MCVLVVQSCPTLCDPWTVAYQARVLEWVAILFSGLSLGTDSKRKHLACTGKVGEEYRMASSQEN